MKKLLTIVFVAGLTLAVSGCMGVRGHDGSGKVCENQTFLGISLIEVFSPCNR